MFISFISLGLGLSVLVSKATGNKNVALQEQLARSITHVNEMLVDMENKIERERKILSEIDSKLNQEEQHKVDVLLTHPDYDGLTDIWWPTTVSTEHHMDGEAVTAAATATLKYGNATIVIKSTPSLLPRPPPTGTGIFGTVLPKLQLNQNPKSPLVTELYNNMELNHHGYFTAFAEKLMELVYTKKESEAYPVAHHMAVLIKKKADTGTFKNVGPDLLGALEGKLEWFETLSPTRVKEQAGVAHYMLKIIDESVSNDLKSLLRYYDTMFTKEEGVELFESLEPFLVYPQGNASVEPIAERMVEAIIVPYIKSEGTRKQKRLIRLIFMATHDIDPHFRAQTMSSLKNGGTGTDANHSTKDHNQSPSPERRSMNYKKIVKHFLVKHPKLFRKIKRQYRYDHKNGHHRFPHTRKRHSNYRKSRGGHQRRERLYDREQTRKRAYTGSSYETEYEEDEADSSESGAYYRENSKAYQQKNIHKVQRGQKSEIPLGKLKQRTQKQRNTKQKQWNLLKGTRKTTKPYQDDPQHLKQLAIRFLRKKQQAQNFHRNRRFNIPSSEEEICNHSQNFQESIENDMLHKIREASSYSDEEDHLRNNLYDALRHGNRTFVSFRKSDGGVNKKNTLRDLSSETDEEWILKNNIYKVFEQEKK